MGFVFFGERKENRSGFCDCGNGIRPDTGFLQNSGIALGSRGEILVNEYLETNIPNVYALGDAIPEVALAGPANRQGRIVANNIFGKRERYQGSIGSSVIKVLICRSCYGKNERQLKQSNMDYEVLHLYPNSHAGYYRMRHNFVVSFCFKRKAELFWEHNVSVMKRWISLLMSLQLRSILEELSMIYRN
ncbi:Coenzyme A disulfide reductase [Fusobacterium necrophorum subsp. necrophorum]|nr:Coenzyme A disulfide reductase [Fusobacterium necrophorum subsp. necrophorum]